MFHTTVCVDCRLLGTLDLPLREAVTNGRQSINATLKGKKGDTLDVSGILELTYCAMV